MGSHNTILTLQRLTDCCITFSNLVLSRRRTSALAEDVSRGFVDVFPGQVLLSASPEKVEAQVPADSHSPAVSAAPPPCSASCREGPREAINVEKNEKKEWRFPFSGGEVKTIIFRH